MYGWDCPILTFIYPGFDCGSNGNHKTNMRNPSSFGQTVGLSGRFPFKRAVELLCRSPVPAIRFTVRQIMWGYPLISGEQLGSRGLAKEAQA